MKREKESQGEVGRRGEGRGQEGKYSLNNSCFVIGFVQYEVG